MATLSHTTLLASLEEEIVKLEKLAESLFKTGTDPATFAMATAAQAQSDILIDQMFATKAATTEDRAAKVRVLKRFALGPEWLECLELGDLQQTRTDAVLSDLG